MCSACHAGWVPQLTPGTRAASTRHTFLQPPQFDQCGGAAREVRRGLQASRARAHAHELSRLLGELTAAAAVAFMVATSAKWRECTRARREEIDLDSGWDHLRAPKRQTRDRRFVVAHPGLLSLFRYAAEHAPGQDPLFPPWTNVRRDLLDACIRAGIERCSPNDLRRTYGHWMRIAASPDEIIAPTMGPRRHPHAGTGLWQALAGRAQPAPAVARARRPWRLHR
jgi:integrase